MKSIASKILEFLDRWHKGAMTGELVFRVIFNQGGVRSVGISENTNLKI